MRFAPLVRNLFSVQRRFRQARMIARAIKSPHHPILAHIVPMRRCNLSCAYCNEYDQSSNPVPTAEMLRRVELLAALGTGIVTFSGGEPLLHPELDEITKAIREHGMIATLITNGYLLTPEWIRRLNRAGLEHLQISIDNVLPDGVSKKSLQVLDKKLQWLAELAVFDVNINSVLGGGMQNPEDARTVAHRAVELGFETTLGIIHDHSGQLQPLEDKERAVYEQMRQEKKPAFMAFAYDNLFHKSLALGLPNDWHCRAGSRYLYICEDGLVHYCSQRRGYPAIPLEQYTGEDLDREYLTRKPCSPYCSISCVHRVAMIDLMREKPREALAAFFPPAAPGAPASLPPGIRVLASIFLPPANGKPHGAVHKAVAVVAMKLLGIK